MIMKKKTGFLLFVFLLLLASTISWVSLTYFGPADLFYLKHFNHLFAIYGFIFFFLQFALSAKVQWLEKNFGLDQMLALHRNFGRLALGFLTLHFLALLAFELLAFGRFYLFLFRWIGIVALAAMFVTALVAFHYKRWNIPYETWKNIHRINYALYPFVLPHVFYNAEPGSFLYYLWIAFTVAFAALLLHKLLRFLGIRRHPYHVERVQQENDQVWSIYFRGPSFAYKPGQFLYVHFPRHGKFSSMHPFTISSSPTGDELAITPKELGDFTRSLEKIKPGDRAFIDAPYGIFSFLHYEAEELVFIAGGIGITPFMSMLRYMQDMKVEIKTTLFWANQHAEDLLFNEELENMEKELKYLKRIYIMSRQEDWPGEQGRLSGALIQKHITDPGRPRYFICGPPALSKALKADLAGLGVHRDRIHLEIFEF